MQLMITLSGSTAGAVDAPACHEEIAEADRESDRTSGRRNTPRRSTIEFLRQFARCYQPQSALPYPLSELYAN